MASFTFLENDGGDERDDRGSASPIAAHPAFPAIVATWFAVLLGLGTLVIPAVLLERLVQASGIAAFVPAAIPPLGVTARALCAGTAAAIGILLGLALARRVAGGPRAALAAPAMEAPRPLAVLQEIGEPGVESESGFPEIPAAVPPFEEPEAEMGEESMEAESAPPLTASPDASAEHLGLEQLVERLGHAIENRRARLREAARPAPLARPQGIAAFAAAAPEEAAQAAAAYFARPVDFPATSAPADKSVEPWDDEGDALSDASYGSLLSLGNPLAYRDGGDSVDDGEAREIPAADTDAALRAALERLQRLSGVA